MSILVIQEISVFFRSSVVAWFFYVVDVTREDNELSSTDDYKWGNTSCHLLSPFLDMKEKTDRKP